MELKPIFDIDTDINQSEYCWLPAGFSDEEFAPVLLSQVFAELARRKIIKIFSSKKVIRT